MQKGALHRNQKDKQFEHAPTVAKLSKVTGFLRSSLMEKVGS